MSPLKKKKLNIVRNKLDMLDNKLIKIIKQRTKLVNNVLSLKEKKNQIIDKSRIKKILNNIKNKSIKNNIDTKVTKRIWINMIYAFIDYEKRNFRKK